ncbi:MAG TPA: ABC transporter permease [Vicinamibacterales bacterium]|jgi:predicted permease
MNLRDLFLRLRALMVRHRVERELHEELTFHIERETQKHLAGGLSPVDARTRALARFGAMPLAADQCRDARGTGVVDDLARDILYALRTFRRAPLAALTIVATVALGLGLSAMAFTLYSAFFLRSDAVPNASELVAVEVLAPSPVEGSTRSSVDGLSFTPDEYEAMRRETSVFTDAVAMLPPVRTRIGGRLVTGSLVSGNFFQTLGVRAALGRPLSPGDDERFAGRPVIVLSHVGWKKLFAGDPTVIGRSVLINAAPHEIVGVMPDGFRGLRILSPDYWAPLALAGQFRDAHAGTQDETLVEVIGRLKPRISVEAATAALTTWASRRRDLTAVPAKRGAVILRSSQGTLSTGTLTALLFFSPIFFAFGLILMIGCANVANLLLARGVSRQREIGIRLSLGASRRRIVRQLLTENLLLALMAAAGGFVIARSVLEGALYLATTTVPPELLAVDLAGFVPSVTDWRVVAFLMAGATVSTAFFGLAPALYATRLELVRTMRGEVTRAAHPRRARQMLIALQVGASALMLICAAIFLRGAAKASTVEPGLRTSDTLNVPISNEPRRAALLQSVIADPSVAAVAALSQPSDFIVETAAFAKAPAPKPLSADETGRRVTVGMMRVSPGYFELLDVDLVSGRDFTQAERTAEAGVVVVSETISHRLWPDRNAVGQVLRLEAPPSDAGGASPSESAIASRTFTVIGVVRESGEAVLLPDMFTFRGIYVPVGPEHAGTSLILRVRGEPEQARQALTERLAAVDPGLGSITTMRAFAGMQSSVLRFAFQVTVILGGLALILTVSGLFSVLSYIVEQRTKEIGVRMALGATVRSVAGLVLSQSVRPVGIGFAAGASLAAGAAIALMATPAASAIGDTVRVFDPVAYALSGSVVVTACALAAWVPAMRACRLDPVATLRQD